jgi:hypothetical protein
LKIGEKLEEKYEYIYKEIIHENKIEQYTIIKDDQKCLLKFDFKNVNGKHHRLVGIYLYLKFIFIYLRLRMLFAGYEKKYNTKQFTTFFSH